jgi:hypothetical protein
MDDIKRELDKLSSQIKEAKGNVATYTGQKIELMKQLKELGYSTIAEAEKAIAKLTKEIESKKEKINADFAKLKEQYDW